MKRRSLIRQAMTTPEGMAGSVPATTASDSFDAAEFPDSAAPWRAQMDRRRFLQVMGASLAMAGLSGCRPKMAERIVPFVKAPEDVVPGKSRYYASALTLGGYAEGVLVRTETGRPLKIEGNPAHPSSRGGTDVFLQAAILGMYDPERSKSTLLKGEPRDWQVFTAAAATEFERLRAVKGAGLAILTETVTSPTLAHQIERLKGVLPRAKWFSYEPINRANVYQGSELVYGKATEPIYRLDQCDVVVSLDADFLYAGPGRIRYSGDMCTRRRVRKAGIEMVRHYAIESSHTSTGSTADHRLAMRAGEVAAFTSALATKLGVRAPAGDNPSGDWSPWIEAIADDLKAHSGKCCLIAGDEQSPMVHGLVHAINESLGAIGKTVEFVEPLPYGRLDQGIALSELCDEMASGAVQSVFILGGNPAFTAPVDVPFADALAKVPFSVHLSPYVDETSDLCLWHVPMAHELESWGDAKSFDGTITLQQPMIEPLYGGKTAVEVLASFMGAPRSGREIIEDRYRSEQANFDEFWKRSLSDGFLEMSAAVPVSVAVKDGWFAGMPGLRQPKVTGLELTFRPDPCLYDGRFANNAWLQELPKPITKISWDNVAIISPATAKQLGVTNRVGPTGKEILVSLADLSYRGKTLTRVPVWIQPGHPDGSVGLQLGFGRLKAGPVGNSVGFNAYALRHSSALGFEDGVTLVPRKEEYSIAVSQVHGITEGRKELRIFDLAEFGKESGHGEHEEISLYPKREYKGYAWAMVFDTTVCTGCNACIMACQAENNIPTVGKTDVLRGRGMHWLRIDRYYLGDDESEVHHLPVNCMQCEQAPCEVVCPAAATVHSAEGLNDMVYNRCVGTRYCANNCPYKARRFNYRQYVDIDTPVLKLMRNPDVTVRGRGVMEKCTYCVQRINAARKQAKREGRKILDGEIQTACQAACPAGGIIFGDLNDPKSAVSLAKQEPHHYALLEELNTRPRTTHLARFKNPNPKLTEALKSKVSRA